MKRAKIVLTLFLTFLTVSLSGCSVNDSTSSKSTPSPTTPTPTPLPLPTPTPVPGIAPTPLILPASVETDKSSYLPGEKVRISVTLENPLSEEVTIYSFPPEVIIEGMLARQPIKVFPSGSEEVKLKPGQKISFNLVWDQKSDGKQVLPGRYEIRLTPIRVENCNTCFYSAFKEILITYSQGALNKTLELNLSEGKIVLQKIVFTSQDTKFYLQTNVPVVFPEVPGNIPPPLPTPPDVLVAYSAELRVDGKEYPIKPWAYKPDGKWTVIFIANPVPNDARKLNLLVNDVEFKFSLKN